MNTSTRHTPRLPFTFTTLKIRNWQDALDQADYSRDYTPLCSMQIERIEPSSSNGNYTYTLTASRLIKSGKVRIVRVTFQHWNEYDNLNIPLALMIMWMRADGIDKVEANLPQRLLNSYNRYFADLGHISDIPYAKIEDYYV